MTDSKRRAGILILLVVLMLSLALPVMAAGYSKIYGQTKDKMRVRESGSAYARVIDQIKKNHLTRMLRIDKLSLAALEYALRYSVDPALAAEHIPALHMLSRTEDDCRAICRALKEKIRDAAPEVYADLVFVQDEAGGGSLPDVFLDGAALAIQVGALRPEALEKKLRTSAVPVIARISRDSLLLSARTLLEDDLDEIAAALARINQEAKA